MSENARYNRPIAEEESKEVHIMGGNFPITTEVHSDLDKRHKNETVQVR